jgi:16S rRNA (guanine527-N7)-methyltransferase
VSKEATDLQQGVQSLGFDITPNQCASLLGYLDALEITNRSFNLTRIPRAEYVSLHLLDSLTALTVIPKRANISILDIGTGAGFPGVPLAALLPDAQVTLLDSTAKKVRFASDTAQSCGITNCLGIHARAEDLARDPRHRAHYDVVISRAVAAFPDLITLMLPLVKKGGIAVALKGSKALEELQGTESRITKLGGGPAAVTTIALPGSDIARHIIVAQKLR